MLASENWGFGLELIRAQVAAASLRFEPGSMEGIEDKLGPELSDLVRDHVEAELIDVYDVGVEPTCYRLRLEVPPNGKDWVSEQSSKPFEGRWKNTSPSESLYSSVYSDNRRSLENAMAAISQSAAAKQPRKGSNLFKSWFRR